jgi:hypothetical protein
MLIAAATIVSGCGGSNSSAPSPARAAGCSPAQVHYTPYPGHGDGLSGLPWIRGVAGSHGLVGLLWYWPPGWQDRHVAEARIYTHGKAPAGYSTKILWAFLADSARARGGNELTVRGRRLDGPGAVRQRFAAIGYSGQGRAPSYASIIDLPRPGCWRLRLSTGALRGTVDLRAIRG